jgi:hypothetical protein
MPKRTLALIVGLLILTVVLLFAATRTSLTPKPQPTTQPSVAPQMTVTPTPPAYTTLELSPNPLTLPPSGLGSVQVLINTEQNTASGIQLELSYDPKALTNVKIVPGTFFKNPQLLPLWNTIDTKNGRISHAQVLLPSQDGSQGKGIVATITFNRLPGTTLSKTSIEFLPKTAVQQAGINPSVLKTSVGTTILLGSSTPAAQQPVVLSPTP